MTEPTRVAGWGRLADGSHVTWTVAEGRRGRRWREVVAGGTTAGQAVLLETAPDGRFDHLELARPDGLWTFHPEGDGTLHGNHVGEAEPGVRHVAGWPFGPGDVLLVEGSLVSAAAIAWAHRDRRAPGESTAVAGVVIGQDGSLAANAAIAIDRLDERHWTVGQGSPIAIDNDGLPVVEGGGRAPLDAG